MTSDPTLEAVYKRAQEQERKRIAKQAKFDKAIAEGVLDVDGVPIAPTIPRRCSSEHQGTRCGYPEGHNGKHSSGRPSDPVRW